jgi:hypothetical protein
MYRLKPWQIITLGGIAVAAGFFAVALVAHVGYSLFPGGWIWVGVVHLLANGAAYWFISKPFIEAYLLRIFLDTRAHIAPLDVFDQEEN